MQETKEIIGDKKQVLYKNNRIVKAKYNLNMQQNKIYQYILFKMQYSEDDNSGVYRADITTNEFKKIIKNKNEWKNESIKEILTTIRKSTIYIEETCKDGVNKKWVDYSPITGSSYDSETDIFTIEASKTIYTLLKEYLQDGYTPVNVTVFLSLGNTYAQRLYELLRLWSNKKTVINYSIETLKELLMLEGKYERYPDFKRRVITPAIKELNEKAQLDINVKECKKGRKVVSLDFIVKDLDNRIYFKKDKESVNIDSNSDFYIPEELKMSENCKNRFINKFDFCDFSSKLLKDILFDAEARTLEKDEAEMITYKNFALFQTILSNKLLENQTALEESLKEGNSGYKDMSWSELEEKLTI